MGSYSRCELSRPNHGQTAPYRLIVWSESVGEGGGLLTSYAWACGPPIGMKIVSSLRLEVVGQAGVATHPVNDYGATSFHACAAVPLQV
jgi:hypothetical protein